MDWNEMRSTWKRQPLHDAEAASIEALRERDDALRRTVRRRDLVETVAAVAVAAFFCLVAAGALHGGEWARAATALWLVAWAVFVPFHMRRARRAADPPEPGLPLVEHLRRRRDAALAQSRMLESAWLWYASPAALGVAAFMLASTGPTRGTLIFLAFTVAFGAGVGWLNRRAARVHFRPLVDALQRQIDGLSRDASG